MENETIEFKSNYTENIFKEIVAFLNSYSGTIYVGYSDDGKLLGLKDSKKIEELISNGISNKIEPDCAIFVSIENKLLDNKNYIVIKVNKAPNVYYLKDKGITKGTYIRNGSCSKPATGETIKQMLIRKSSLSFEESISIKQNLTFNYIEKAFDEVGINIKDERKKQNLHMLNNKGEYTNLALLLSDENPYSIKVAVYESLSKNNFIDRKEFTGSLL